jgi:hypothetical protein
MSLQHTPGPWHAHHDHGWLVVESDNGDLYVKVEKGSAARKHMADARLIAAAPDLLAVLQELEESSCYWSEYDVPLGIVDRIRAAISKAN